MSTFQATFERSVRLAHDRAFGVSVMLIQAGKPSEPFTAVWEDQDYDVADGEGYLTKIHSRDFMFDRSHGAPRAGDLIQLTEAGKTKRFEILPLGDMPAVQEMEGGQRWRVHTKQTK